MSPADQRLFSYLAIVSRTILELKYLRKDLLQYVLCIRDEMDQSQHLQDVLDKPVHITVNVVGEDHHQINLQYCNGHPLGTIFCEPIRGSSRAVLPKLWGVTRKIYSGITFQEFLMNCYG
ncbi:uncharacterized protein LOC126418682 [Schistocerca serialis cubense]|uniref:uncharacterized protein LOC126418682 n=1 Tax=Schistocerca serialis cubense TaxID=2023355 RepID=UPI00214EB8C7|nr:uncharacterized protein LOC126418682 [Schistocerca serialis cubense]